MRAVVETVADDALPMYKTPFIRVTEIWVPNEEGTHLVLADGLFSGLDEFERVARETRFAPDEGLPGKAWAAQRPIVLKDLVNSYFRRGAAAAAAGLTCAVAIPVFGDTLKGVLVLFCGDDPDHVGAIELWHASQGSYEMSFVDGYFGTADSLEWAAKHMLFMKGTGLPGETWQRGQPVVFAGLRGTRFLRFEKAEEVGITRTIGIPVHTPAPGDFVLTLLSAQSTPIARRVEIWMPDGAGGLTLTDGFCERAGSLAGASRRVALGEGTIGTAAATGVPAVSGDLERDDPSQAAPSGLETLVALPVHTDGFGVTLAVWYL